MKKTLMIIFFSVILSGCYEQYTRDNRDNLFITNSSHSVNRGYGRVLLDNPIILSNDPQLDPRTNLAQFISPEANFITYNPTLTESCLYGIDNCYSVQKDKFSTPLSALTGGKWAFPVQSAEFLQVHTFFHVKQSVNFFHNSLRSAYNRATDANAGYTTSLPANLFTSFGHWEGMDKTLLTYSHCDIQNSAYFDPATLSICLGNISFYPWLYIAQDPTIIYHELGHAYIRFMLNARNTNLTVKSDLGTRFYDEMGSIGEGVADYFSYAINHRAHFGEWGLGFFEQSRPLKESDPLHPDIINSDEDFYLSYPAFLNYDPNDLKKPIEDIHLAGQIISHYLVTLTEDLENYCSVDKAEAIDYVLHIMAESFAEMGDLNARGSDQASSSNINLNTDHALLWNQTVLPINFKNFAQKIGKYLLSILGNSQTSRCNSGVYPKERIEKIQDKYGLLLYKTYNENGNNAQTGHTGTSTLVNQLNRLNTVLIAKRFIKLDPTENATEAYVLDDRTNMLENISALQSAGKIGTLSPQTSSGLAFNNSNNKPSPGEVIAIALNLYNDSNSTMGGIQILANDWDHAKNGLPCNTFDDNFPLDSEGAADSSSESSTSPSVGDCHYITRQNGDENEENLAPVCLVQINEEDSTKWAFQNELMKKLDLEPEKCLSGSSKTNDCFMRAIRGADQAFYSKINPKRNATDPFLKNDSILNPSSYIFFEINEWAPPGTVFNCRFRVRFSNCENCFTDPDYNNDDYLDYQYSGAKPFKIVNLRLTIVD